MRNQKGAITVGSIILIIILIIGLLFLFSMYRKNYFSGFEKAISVENATKFSRDSREKYSDNSSYKIENYNYNDAAFYKEIEVEPDTPYRITCMVKTENVERELKNEDGGVTIGLMDTTQYSYPIEGTNDWQKIEYVFNSHNLTTAKISFRLGGNTNKCKGTVWFSDFKLEKGIQNEDNEWKIGCFLINELDVKINDKNYNLKMNLTDKENVKLNIERFKDDCYQFSNKKMTVTYDTYEIKEPITTISYSDEHGYYISPKDVKEQIYPIVKENEYDHIFVVCRMENDDGSMLIPIKDNWIGLGGMDMYGIGFSLVRINSRANSYNYKYGITNQAPEEVYLHEFLHTLERNCLEDGYETPALHDYEKYGYNQGGVEGLNEWYEDYMRKEIYDRATGTYVGLNDSVYTSQPYKSENFKYSIEEELYDEPENLFEEIQAMFKVLTGKN